MNKLQLFFIVLFSSEQTKTVLVLDLNKSLVKYKALELEKSSMALKLTFWQALCNRELYHSLYSYSCCFCKHNCKAVYERWTNLNERKKGHSKPLHKYTQKQEEKKRR